jgi:lipoprotein signal peptidase
MITMAKLNREKMNSDKKNNMGTVRSNWEFPLEKKNLQFLGLSFIVIIVGYLLMATSISEEPALVDGTWNNFWAINVAPVILVIGYCVMIPFSIIYDFKSKKEQAE